MQNIVIMNKIISVVNKRMISQLDVFSDSRTPKAAPADMVMLRKTEEAMGYLEKEHEEKVKLIILQQKTAESKKRAQDAKYEYYAEKRCKYIIDL